MLKITVCAIMTAFCILGIMAAAYLIMLLLLKNDAKKKRDIILIKLTGNINDDIRSVMYAYERINLFGENKTCKIIVADYGENKTQSSEIKRIFALCECVKIVKREELMSYIDNL